MEPRKLGKPIDYISGMCMGNLNSQNALHVESAKQLFITIFIPVVEHTPTLRHSMFLFLLYARLYYGMALSVRPFVRLLARKNIDANGGFFSNFVHRCA